MRDDDDLRRARRPSSSEPGAQHRRASETEAGVEPERTRGPGKSNGGAAHGSGPFIRYTQGLATAPDPVAETEAHVRKARALVAALHARPSPARDQELRAALIDHLEKAESFVGRLAHQPGARDAIASYEQLRDEAANVPTTAADDGPTKLPDNIRTDLESATGQSLDHVRVHANEAGASTAAGHGARAVAIGSDIFMGKGEFDPSSADGRELIAHEVAHTVQAEAHPGPVAAAAKRDGASTEAAEVDADSFASSFRKSGAGARWTPAVGVGDRTPMRAPSVARQSSPGALAPTAPIYVNSHRVQIVSAIRDRINAVGLADPHPRLRWTTQEQAKAAIAAAIAEHVEAASDFSLKQLMKLSYPADLLAIVEAARGEGGAGWNPNVGLAVALAMSEPIDASIQRMGMRVRVQLDANATMPRASDLVASSPLDGVIASILVRPGMVLQSAKKRDGVDDTPGKPFADGVHEVTYEWQGSRDPNLWNWIKVTSPKHATAEDVAHTPLAGGEVKDGSEQAYRIVAKPPYFGIPFETARLVPEALQHAPLKVRAQLDAGPGPRVADAGVLDQSAVSDDAALAQAPKPTKADLPASRALERAKAQLDFLWQRLSPWNASAPLVGATVFVERRRADLERDPASGTHWQTTLAAQERALYLASSEAAEVVTQIEARAKPSDAEQLQPAVRLLQAYAHAAGVSHLAADAMPALEEARRQRALLPVTLAEDKIRAAHEGAAALRGAQSDSGATAEAGADAAVGEVPDLDRRAADLRLRSSRGESPDPDTVDQLAVDGDELALRERILTIKTQVAAVVHRADEVGLPKPTFSGGIPTPRALAHVLLDKKVPEWLGVLERGKHWRGPVKGKTAAQTITHQMRQAVDQVAQDITGFNEIADVGQWLQWANKANNDQELSNRIKSLALQLGIMIVTGEIAGAAVTAMRGVALGTQLISDVRGAGLAYKAAEIGIHAGLATLGQGTVGGDLSGGAFAENAIGILATSAAMKPFEGLLADSEAVEQEVQRSWAQTAKRGAKIAAELVIETGAGITGSAIAHAATHGMDAAVPGSDDLIVQGLALAASRFVGQRMQGMHERIEAASRELGPAAFEKLLSKVDALKTRALGAKQPSIPEARAYFVQRRQFLDEEREIYRTHAKASDPVEARAATSALKELESDLAATPVTATLRMAGLTPVVDGHIYEGTPSEVKDAIAAVNASGPQIKKTYDPATHVYRIEAGQKAIEIHEVVAPTRTASTESHEGTNRGVEKEQSRQQQRDEEHDVAKTKTPEFRVERKDLVITTQRDAREWSIEVQAPLANGRTEMVAQGTAPLDATGQPSDGPDFYIQKDAHVNGVQGKVQVYENGKKVSLTDVVLDVATARFTAEFGHPPHTLPGQLAFENKRNFQRAYAEAMQQGKDATEAKQIAIRKISFGRSRIERGYDDITVDVGDETAVDLGPPLGVQRVPTWIHVVARKSKP